MRSIVGLKFLHQVFNVKVNRGLGNRKLIGNLFVAIAISNEAKNLQIPRRKVLVTQVFGETSRHFWRNMRPASVNGSNHPQKFIFWHALKYVSRRSCPPYPLNLPTAVRVLHHLNITPSNS